MITCIPFQVPVGSKGAIALTSAGLPLKVTSVPLVSTVFAPHF